MLIEAVTLQGIGGQSGVQWDAIRPGLNAVFSTTQLTTSEISDFLSHALFGQLPASVSLSHRVSDGEIIVHSADGRYRLRRSGDGAAIPKLTVSALDGSPVHRSTVRELVGRLSPTVLAPLCAVSFRDPPNIDRLLNSEFAREFQSLAGARPIHSGRRTAELSARRDLLAQELETRIAAERRASKELDARWRELDRLVRDEQQQVASREQRLPAVEAALAETDTRLRYRRLEVNAELRWHANEPEDREPQLAELDNQIARWRAALAELGQREASIRASLAEIQSSHGAATAAVVDQRAWLSVARQLAADLTGEVARLARASASQQCVCREARPRLRPIAETVQRQLDVLESLVDEQQRVLTAAELQKEVESLSRTQAELRRHLENLLERRELIGRGVKPSSRATTVDRASTLWSEGNWGRDDRLSFSAADAEQLEERRVELENERFRLAEQLNEHSRKLRDLRAQRDTVERQRAALLSARSIDHVQRELADVQRKLEQVVMDSNPHVGGPFANDDFDRASDFLAQLTDGELVQLILVDSGHRARVVDRCGQNLAFETLAFAQRDLVYLSLCLGLLSAAAQHGVWLPLVLNDPFTRLDARATAALVAVLDGFCRQGHQVIVFTTQSAAAERLSSIGAAIHDVDALRLQIEEPQHEAIAGPRRQSGTIGRQSKRRQAQGAKRRSAPSKKTAHGEAASSDQSDAA